MTTQNADDIERMSAHIRGLYCALQESFAVMLQINADMRDALVKEGEVTRQCIAAEHEVQRLIQAAKLQAVRNATEFHSKLAEQVPAADGPCAEQAAEDLTTWVFKAIGDHHLSSPSLAKAAASQALASWRATPLVCALADALRRRDDKVVGAL